MGKIDKLFVVAVDDAMNATAYVTPCIDRDEALLLFYKKVDSCRRSWSQPGNFEKDEVDYKCIHFKDGSYGEVVYFQKMQINEENQLW